MKIGIVDVDSHNFPNFALMKISSYYRKMGCNVEFADLRSGSYDEIWASKIFTFTPDITQVVNSNIVNKGGTGYDITKVLPNEIENISDLDYSLYPSYKGSIMFFSRGCIRNCPFCLVRQKEGRITPVKHVNLNPNGTYIEVLDNNFFANPTWREAIEYLTYINQPVKLSGVDVRIMDEEQAVSLNKLKIKGGIHIAWDDPNDDITSNIRSLIKHVKPYKIICYVLTGFNSTLEQDYYRVKKLWEFGIVSHVQPYRDYTNKRVPSQRERDFARWANNRIIFKSCDFKDYMPRKGFTCKSYFNHESNSNKH